MHTQTTVYYQASHLIDDLRAQRFSWAFLKFLGGEIREKMTIATVRLKQVVLHLPKLKLNFPGERDMITQLHNDKSRKYSCKFLKRWMMAFLFLQECSRERLRVHSQKCKTPEECFEHVEPSVNPVWAGGTQLVMTVCAAITSEIQVLDNAH